MTEFSDKYTRIVVAVDPAVGAGRSNSETGIIVAGLGVDQFAYVMDDLSFKGSPAKWAYKVISAYWEYKADRVVAEINQGGDLVEQLLRSFDPKVSYKGVRASRGKVTRA
ncbi:MAG: ATP-binding protein, partial [Alphaproteobacteria bacterium]|nr:ATP-binding protein [Alphaproteobacteria bacterium]